MATKRMTANPIKAPRYRPGKALAEESSSSDSETSDNEANVQSKPIAPPPKVTTAVGITSSLKNVDLTEGRRLAVAQEAARLEEEKAARAKNEEGFVTESESEEESGSTPSGEGESSEEEAESEEQSPKRLTLRPTFIRKDKRRVLHTVQKDADEEALQITEEVRKKAAADAIVEAQIAKDVAAKEAGKKSWDDDENEVDEVDDTDGLYPEAEYAAWKLRELKRIKREREIIEEREKEAEEIERRKNLTEEERKAEDDAFLAQQKEEKEGRGKMAYLQKYYHKGAFYQEDAKAEGLDKRDIMGGKYADDVDRELLPQALQVRDMTKIGKKGATKYKDLKSEDTGRWGEFGDRRTGKTGSGAFGFDDRFRPDTERGGLGASGANSTPLAERKKVDGAPTGPKVIQEGSSSRPKGDAYLHDAGSRDRRSRTRSPRKDRRRDHRGRSGSSTPPRQRHARRRSRSNTPPRRRDHNDRRPPRSTSPARDREQRHYRKRSFSRSPFRHESDKRRKVDPRP